MQKLKIRGGTGGIQRAVACREPFDTHGSMKARVIGEYGLDPRFDSGRLSGPDLDAFRTDATAIRYVVWSYATPIGWATLSGRWHRVEQEFSVATSRQQGLLPLSD